MSSKYLVARLLSGRNRLSRREKDVLFERVVTELTPRRRFRRPAVLLALAGAAAAILALPWVIQGRGDRPRRRARRAPRRGALPGDRDLLRGAADPGRDQGPVPARRRRPRARHVRRDAGARRPVSRALGIAIAAMVAIAAITAARPAAA